MGTFELESAKGNKFTDVLDKRWFTLSYIQHPDDSIALYMSVFQKLFDYAGHLSHYNIMMGEEVATSDPVELPMSA
nr:hypothetical protein BCS91_21940 [Vibrio cyclitrophicus]